MDAHSTALVSENASRETAEADLDVLEPEANHRLHWQSLHSTVQSEIFTTLALLMVTTCRSIFPLGGSGMCKAVKCISDLNRNCPAGLELRNIKGRIVGCKSACMAFHKPEFCCTGVFNSPRMCGPSSYSKVFKASCPMAYSYAYDDATSTFTCYGADYIIRFC
ncbi:hypothetical protein RYX36_023913 [Vicia faba]